FLNLKTLSIDDQKLPIVFQYNKRDLPGVLPASELERELNARRFPTYLASAKTGEGVLDTLNGVCNLLMGSLKAQLVEGQADGAPSERMAAASPVASGARPRVITPVQAPPPVPTPMAHAAPPVQAPPVQAAPAAAHVARPVQNAPAPSPPRAAPS